MSEYVSLFLLRWASVQWTVVKPGLTSLVSEGVCLIQFPLSVRLTGPFHAKNLSDFHH